MARSAAGSKKNPGAPEGLLNSIEEIRSRFTTLQRPLTFFDGPGGTQVPDSVIDAISSYLHQSNANSGMPFASSRATDELVEGARTAAAQFLQATKEEIVFGTNMTTLNFALSRAAARGWRAGDEIVCTRLDHDANISPWLELSRDMDLEVRFCDIDTTCRLDLDHLRSLLSERTRVVAFPWASNAVGTVTPAAEVVSIAHEAGALAWIDAVHYAPHDSIDVRAVGADVLLVSPYKFYGPHLGLAFGRRELLESWRPYNVRPLSDGPPGHRYETGTPPFELIAGFVAAVDYLTEVGWNVIRTRERELGRLFLDGLPDRWMLHGPPTMDGRVSTFAITHESLSPAEAAVRLADRGLAVWHGDYYAIEIMKSLGLAEGAVRIGIVHYNTEEEVDLLREALSDLDA